MSRAAVGCIPLRPGSAARRARLRWRPLPRGEYRLVDLPAPLAAHVGRDGWCHGWRRWRRVTLRSTWRGSRSTKVGGDESRISALYRRSSSAGSVGCDRPRARTAQLPWRVRDGQNEALVSALRDRRGRHRLVNRLHAPRPGDRQERGEHPVLCRTDQYLVRWSRAGGIHHRRRCRHLSGRAVAARETPSHPGRSSRSPCSSRAGR